MFSAIQQKLRQSPYLRDIAWQGAGSGLAQVIGLLAMPILTRLYSPSDFGTLSLFTQAVALCAIFLTWRYEYMVVLPKNQSDAASLLRFLTLMGVTLACVSTPLAYWQRHSIAALLGDKLLEPWLVLVPLAALVMSLSVALQQQLQRQQDYRNSGLSEVINKTGYVASGLLGALMLPNLFGFIAASTIGLIGKSLWLLKSFKKFAANAATSALKVPASAMAREYFHLSGSWVISHSMLSMVGILTIVFIVKSYDVGTVGQYTLVVSTLYLPSSLLGNSIGQVYYQRAARQHANGEPFDDLWRSTAKHLLMIGTPVFAVVALLSTWAYPFVFGSDWQPAGQYAVVLALSAALAFMTAPMDRTCLVVGAWWYSPLWHGSRLATTILVIWLAWYFDWPFRTFLNCLVAQMATLYIIDGWAGWRFATRRV